MATVKGIWVFNETIDSSYIDSQTISFTSNSLSFTDINSYDRHTGFPTHTLGYLNYNTTKVYGGDSDGWINQAYRTIDFGSSEQEVSEDFYNWLTANATPVIEPEPEPSATIITYNGKTIAALKGGQKATLTCCGMQMTSDVVVSAAVTQDGTIPDGYIKPSGTKAVTENGEHDVTEYAKVNVDVPIPDPVLQEKTVTENGEITPDDGYDGLSKVTVNVQAEAAEEYDGAATVRDGSPASLISFTINGTTYQAENGMTWGEWVESEYNTIGCYINDGGIVYYWLALYSDDYLSPTNYGHCPYENEIVKAGIDWVVQNTESGGSN